MTATNHALTGAIIGLTVPSPVVACAAAFLSHFVLDTIPHFGGGKDFIKTKAFRNLLVVDAFLCLVLVLCLASFGGNDWWIAALCAFLAAAPDLASFNRYRHALRGTPWKAGWFTNFAKRIQWFERPIGAFVEAVWFVASVSVLVILL